MTKPIRFQYQASLQIEIEHWLKTHSEYLGLPKEIVREDVACYMAASAAGILQLAIQNKGWHFLEPK